LIAGGELPLAPHLRVRRGISPAEDSSPVVGDLHRRRLFPPAGRQARAANL